MDNKDNNSLLPLPRQIFSRKSLHEYLQDHNYFMGYDQLVFRIKESNGYLKPENRSELEAFNNRNSLKRKEVMAFVKEWILAE